MMRLCVRCGERKAIPPQMEASICDECVEAWFDRLCMPTRPASGGPTGLTPVHTP